MVTTKQSLVCGLVALFLTVGTVAFAQTNRNTAFGFGALQSPSNTGFDDSAFGYDALSSNTTGSSNTAIGVFALSSNTDGSDNTASGWGTLQGNTTGYQNTASGGYALYLNSTGVHNTADGESALMNNSTGYGNEASGAFALFGSSTGFHNTAVGDSALINNGTGHSNIGIGFNGGYNITNSSNNIEIGSLGTSADNNTIRLGTQGTQKATYIAGISGTAMTGADVVVSSTGRLGVLPSSARYKKDIQPMSDRSNRLWQLRPVTFRYKQDPSQRQYGLIAEQVAKVYPELVVRGDKGEIESVQYRELIPLMLNEMQHQQAALTALKAQNDVLRATLAQQNAVFAARLERLERTSAKTVASR